MNNYPQLSWYFEIFLYFKPVEGLLSNKAYRLFFHLIQLNKVHLHINLIISSVRWALFQLSMRKSSKMRNCHPNVRCAGIVCCSAISLKINKYIYLFFSSINTHRQILSCRTFPYPMQNWNIWILHNANQPRVIPKTAGI